MGTRKTWILDIDDTILKSSRVPCPNCGRHMYSLLAVNKELIKKSNSLYMSGDTIILWTGRNWDLYDATCEQLRRIGIHYHELVMGKPQGTLIDTDALRSLP